MKKIAIGNKKHMMKTMGVALTLIFTVSLYAGGVFADTGCGAKCCHQISPGGMHHTTGNPIKSLGDCRSNDSRIPCDLQSKRAAELPEYTLVSSGGGFPNHVLDPWRFPPIQVSMTMLLNPIVLFKRSGKNPSLPPYIFRNNHF